MNTSNTKPDEQLSIIRDCYRLFRDFPVHCPGDLIPSVQDCTLWKIFYCHRPSY